MLPDRVLPQLVIILFFSFRVPTTSSFVQPQDDEEGGEKVEAWDSKITYILATVGYAVGLGKYKKKIVISVSGFKKEISSNRTHYICIFSSPWHKLQKAPFH